MNILENLLKKFIDVPNNLYELTNKHIIEVDEYLKLIDANKLVIGYVETCVEHPNSDHLHVTTVNVGHEVLQIVCGASNIKAGQTVIVATNGTILPGPFEIKKSTIRGVESNGMICSLKELGFDEKHIPSEYADGIYAFEEKIEPGTDAIKVLGLDGSKLILGMTTNRGDLLSHLGFAYDLAAVMNQKLKVILPQIVESKLPNPIKVKLDTDACLTYDARVIEVKIKESPWWLKNALIQSDIRPINNVVDITNYILMMYGTPLHAFDFDKVNSDRIVVRLAQNGEKVVTLDEQNRDLIDSDIVITDGIRPIALGGVMGLANSMIDEKTTKIILEAAAFNPEHISKTSKRLDLKSDSSLRFERGIELERVRLGLEAATLLLTDLADGAVYQGIASGIKKEVHPVWIETSFENLNHLMGTKLTNEEIKSILSRLNYQIDEKKTLRVAAPDYRKDIQIEADLVEEIARIYGYDQIPHHQLSIKNLGGLTKTQKQLRELRHYFAHLGINEAITYSITGEIEGYPTFGETIKVLMPMSDDKKYLRQSLIPGLLSTISYHHLRQINDLGFFEIGNVFAKDIEKQHLAVAISGFWIQSSWLKQELKGDFYTLKGILDLIAQNLGVSLSVVQNDEVNALHPGIQGKIMVGSTPVGVIGKIHPKTEDKYDIKDVYVLEVDLSALLNQKKTVVFESISKFPSVTRDISFIIDEQYAIGDVLALIQQTARKLITNVELFDVYKGENVKEGHQSLAVSITFQNKEKTFEKEDIEKAVKSIKNRLNFTYKAEVRD